MKIIILAVLLCLPFTIQAQNCLKPPQLFKAFSNQDFDGDGVNNSADNCPFVANLSQSDSNSDSVGDACDQDQDGWPNHCDRCVDFYNPDQSKPCEQKKTASKVNHRSKKQRVPSKKRKSSDLKKPENQTVIPQDFSEFMDDYKDALSEVSEAI